MTDSGSRRRGDRCVHIQLADGSEVVRYDTSGKWYREYPDGNRSLLTLRGAASWALEPDAQVFTGRSGGMMFDAAVRRLGAQRF